MVCLTGAVAGCYSMRGSSGGGETHFEPPRQVSPSDIALPDGYQIEAVATGLTFPTDVAFDAEGNVYVTEAGYSYGEVFTTPRLVRLDEGEVVTVTEGDKNGPWNGLAYYDGHFYIAEGGELRGGRILRIDPEDDSRTVLLEGLPSVGDHHTNGLAVGPDGAIYFGQGTATNAAVVGLDNAEFGWLERHPNFHDVPCRDVTLAGRNFETKNPLTSGSGGAVTGAFVPFGTSTQEGQVIEGEVPCNGAVMRIRPEGGRPELVAWGFRNPFGLAFAPDGQLYVTDNGYDDRGSRPVWGAGDLLWAVEPDTWYGWPDFVGGVPIRNFTSPGKRVPTPLLAEYPQEPPHPAAVFGVHSSSNGLDFSRSAAFGYAGDAFVAQFGDMAVDVGKVLTPVGFQVVRVDPQTGVVRGFAANTGKTVGPASKIGGGGFERPVSVRFSPDGGALYVVDFGVMTVSGHGPRPHPGTGVLWRITREE